MFRTLASALLLSAVSLAGVASLSAQTGPSGNPPPGPPAVTPPGIPAPGIAGVAEADLANYLRTLDPNLRVTPSEGGVTIYNLTIRQSDGWSYSLQVESAKGVIYLSVNLGKLPADLGRMNPAVLGALLQGNFKYGPMYFEMGKYKDGTFFLNATRLLDRTVSMERLKGELEILLKKVRESHSIWSVAVNSAR